MTLTKTRPVIALILHRQLQAVVPAVTRLTVDATTVRVERDAGEFTAQDRVALQAVVEAHDATAMDQATAARAETVRAEKAKDTKTLTDKERLTRIETILSLEGG